jgi:hypothetical protein
MTAMFDHKDLLSDLSKNLPINVKLKTIHDVLRQRFDFVDRIAVCLYDRASRLLKTFVASSGRDYPLEFYDTSLDDAPSLKEIIRTGNPRFVNDLSVFRQGEHEHTQRILEQGYRASYTVPMWFNSSFGGFIFFNSYQSNCFEEKTLNELDVYAHLISGIVAQEIHGVRALLTALKVANQITQAGDPETAAHMERLSRFSRLIGQHLARTGKYELTDEDVERIFWFSPAHDLGKVGSPDDPKKGIKQMNALIENLGFIPFEGVDTFKSIAEYHQQKVTGELPESEMKDIPLEARIVAVANLFDAMTSRRPYPPAWSNEEAIALLQRLSKSQLVRDCVEGLAENLDKVEQIQATFLGTPQEIRRWIS